jgi:branched-chain amino acid transport system permease protein
MNGRMTGAKWLAGLAGAALLCAVPRFFSLDYYLHMFVMSEIYAVLAMSLALIVGFSGQVSMGHAAFYGVGAYASALISLKSGLPFWVTIWCAGAVAGLLSFVIGKMVLRLRGHFLAITTAFFGVLVTLILNNWIELTNGPMGVPGIPRPSPISLPGLTLSFETRADYYYLGLVFVGLVAFLLYRLVNSRIGDALIAIRENEELARSIGVDAMAYKVFAFTLGGALAGMAGSFYAHYILFISPVTFTIAESINLLVMIIFGGMTTLFGPVFGAVALTLLPEFLRMAGSLRLVIYGVALVIFIIWLPLGVWGTIKSKWMERRG